MTLCQSMTLLTNEILANIERNERLAKATHYEGISALMTRVSIRPTAEMKRQAERLDSLKFEEREKKVIQNEKSFYGWPEESQLNSDMLDEHRASVGKKCCENHPKCRRFMDHFACNRFWHLCCCSFPLLISSSFSHWTFCSGLTGIYWLGVFLVSSLSVVSQTLNIFMQRPIKIIQSDQVWEHV